MRSSTELPGSSFQGSAQAPRNLNENHTENLILDFQTDFQLDFERSDPKQGPQWSELVERIFDEDYYSGFLES